MAKCEFETEMQIDDAVKLIVNRVLKGSVSASLEDESIIEGATSRCHILVFERYSIIGSNRLSLSVTLFQELGESTKITAITSGGSQAMLFKINTFGEESFLDDFMAIFS